MRNLNRGQRVRILVGLGGIRRVEAEVMYVNRKSLRVGLRFRMPAGPAGERTITCERHLDDVVPLFTEA